MLPNNWNGIMSVLLYFTAARGGRQVVMVKDGDDATLPCEHLLDSQVSCGLTWLLTAGLNTYEVITSGQISWMFMSQKNRLSVMADCSLVIKKVTAQDAGDYFCRIYQGNSTKDSLVSLYVVTCEYSSSCVLFFFFLLMKSSACSPVTVKSIGEETMMASCIVHSPALCQHQVKWLFHQTRVDSKHPHIKTFHPSNCNTTASFPSFLSIYSTKELLQCQVKYSSTELVFDLPPTEGDGGQECSPPRREDTEEPPHHNSVKEACRDVSGCG
uniref:uncharacterized protein LOC131129821 isoform X2 n=1 Tax=Doryrhamphus excisus TaxID=161450 RepID=UPI0025AE6B60|nr:uncharacterized protein LOC131129821 isoform X2 [Doryrhamphus excisus]